MIKILSNTKQTLHLLSQGQLKDYYTEADLQTAEKLIHFITPKANAVGIIHENYIQTPTDIYVIKEINRSDADFVEVFGKLDTDALKATIIPSYDSTERLISEVLVDVLTATGWTYNLHDLPVKRRTVRMEETYAHAIILEAMKIYGFEVWFDSLAKVVHVYQVMGSNRGAYVYSDLNMRKLEQQADTYDFKTRLYAYGKDGLSFADINNGKEYVENHTHSTKILEAIWKDERYTDMASLMADAQARIDILSKPRESFVVEVVELAKLNPTYSVLDFQLGDTATIIDKVNNKRDTQRIVKLTDYPITPEKNIIELANSKITMVQTSDTDAIKKAVDAVSNEIVVVQTELMAAIDAATEKITGETGGNLVIRTNAEGKPYELLIMNTDNIATASKVWRWNQSGLGFSSSGYNGSYGFAITADGKLNADFIAVGTLSASLVRTGLLASNDNSSWIDLDTGYFNFKNKVKFDANGFSLILSSGNPIETDINNAKNAAITAAAADATSKANAAQTAATNAANAKAEAERVLAEAYADGIVDAEEQARIDAVNAAAEAAAADATAKAAAAEAAAKAYADTQLGTFATTIGNTLDGLQDQIDGSITTWFYGVVPTTSNVPASTWNTTTLKNNHLGDLYYNTVTGYAYRWQVVNSVYSWVRITDTDVTKALEDASKAQDTADSKRRVFVVTPTTPYEVGDLWSQGAAGELMRCKTTALTGSYSATHWEKASKYTDDTAANAAATAAANAQTAANTANTALADIASDSKLTATEKQATKKEWDIIVAEKAGIEAQGTLYSITTEKTNYTNAYNALNTYITPLLTSLTTTSTIVGATFRTNFKNYYDARQKLLDKVAAAAKGYTDAQIDVVNGAISLKVSKNDVINQINVSTEGIQISGNKVNIAANTDFTTTVGALEPKITKSTTAPASPVVGQLWLDTNTNQHVLKRWTGSVWSAEGVSRGEFSTVSQTATDVKFAFDNQVIGGENLIRKSHMLSDKFETYQGSSITTLKDGVSVPAWGADNATQVRTSSVGTSDLKARWLISDDITFMTGKEMSFSIWAKNNRTDVSVTISTNRIGEPITLSPGVSKKLEFIGVLPANVSKILVLEVRGPSAAYYVDVTLWHPKWELGNEVTEWSQHPDELMSGITTIDAKGVTVGKEGSTIVTNLHNEGVDIMDGTTKVATFNGGVSEIPHIKATKINANLINTISGGTYSIGTGKQYTTITEALTAIAGTGGYARHLKAGATLKFDIYGTVVDHVYLYDWSGGKIEFNFTSGSRLKGSITAWFCNSLIDIHGANGANGTLIWDGNMALVRAYGCKYVTVSFMNFDKSTATSSTNGARFENGSIGYVTTCDFGSIDYAVLSYTGSIVSCRNNKQNSGCSAGFYMNNGTIFAAGQIPNTGYANSGWYYTTGTLTPTNSSYTPPDQVDTDFTRTFDPTDIYTTVYGSSTRSTYYVDVAVQGRWNTMGSAQVGYFVFGSDVKAFMNSGTVKSVKLKIRRENSTHGLTADVKPIPYGFTPTTAFLSTVCTRGEWSNQVSIDPATIGASSTTFKFYSSAVDSGYAKFDAAQLEVVVTRKV